jgi:hypothetical protein
MNINKLVCMCYLKFVKNKKLKREMSVDFGCIETCIFPDFEDEGMSEEEEDYLDYLLENENEEIHEPDEVWQPPKVYM